MLTSLCQVIKHMHSSKMSSVECVGHPDLMGLHARNQSWHALVWLNLSALKNGEIAQQTVGVDEGLEGLA
jgi:hypothetical protein